MVTASAPFLRSPAWGILIGSSSSIHSALTTRGDGRSLQWATCKWPMKGVFLSFFLFFFFNPRSYSFSIVRTQQARPICVPQWSDNRAIIKNFDGCGTHRPISRLDVKKSVQPSFVFAHCHRRKLRPNLFLLIVGSAKTTHLRCFLRAGMLYCAHINVSVGFPGALDSAVTRCCFMGGCYWKVFVCKSNEVIFELIFVVKRHFFNLI